jgi:hypothetical protein
MTTAPQAVEAPRSWRVLPESPSTLIETMVVLLLLVAMVWFGAAHARAAARITSETAAQDQLAVLSPLFTAYGAENSGFVGMTPRVLARDYGITFDGKIAATLEITATSSTSFCAQVENGGLYVAQRGPAGKQVSARQPIC